MAIALGFDERGFSGARRLRRRRFSTLWHRRFGAFATISGPYPVSLLGDFLGLNSLESEFFRIEQSLPVADDPGRCFPTRCVLQLIEAARILITRALPPK
jgi:hypothetical protein